MRIQDIIPVSIRKELLKRHQEWLWPRVFKQYRRAIDEQQIPSRELIKKLVYAWGNQGFSAQIDYIDTCINKTLNSEGLIFECGSGLSTLLIGTIAKKQNRQMISFEHIGLWADRIQKELKKNQLDTNTIYHRELKDYGAYAWYNIDNFACDKIGMCICDAPPGNTKGGRRGFMYQFKNHFLPGSIILVDDTVRADEQQMIEEWKRMLPMTVEFSGKLDPHAIVTIH